MTSKTQMLMMVAIGVMGMYVLPSVTARFAGSHSMELNTTTGVQGMQCERCHTYIIDELVATTSASDVLTVHTTAANTAAYVNSTGILNITQTDGLAYANRSACLMCHLVTQDRGGLNRTHTKITIRVCTDEKCHGSPTENGVSGVLQWNSTKQNITAKLSRDEDVHSKFYNPLNSSTSYYTRQDSGNYTRGFYACLGCHTHFGMTFNLSRPNMFGFNFSDLTDTDGFMYSFNFTNMYLGSGRNVTTSVKTAGVSIWD